MKKPIGIILLVILCIIAFLFLRAAVITIF